uniref:CLASP_N domain-containing protein n=1 Tax=Rhabditophanes sp. KR3021 TaxID=114890 RepID=A0AC35TZC2_9BILA
MASATGVVKIINLLPIIDVYGTLTRNHYQAKVEGKDFNLADTPNDILFTSDIIPGSSDENSRRILQKIALKNYEHNVAASTLRRNNEKTELEIDETNGYARIVKTPKSIRKNIPTDLPPSPLMGYMTNRETFPSPKYSEKKFSTEFDASLTKRLNLEGKKGQAARKAGNVEGIGDIKIDDGNICESVIKLHQITTTNQQMLLDAENSLNEQVSLLKCRDSPKVNREQNGGVVGARWRSAAFSGTNLKPLSALIPTELRENASKIPKLAHTPSIASKKDVIEEPMMTRSCFLPSPQPELAPTTNDSSSSQIKRNMSSSFQHIKEIKTPPTIKKNKLNKLNHHKSSDQVANDGKKLEIKGEQEKFVMSCCSPIESRRNISRNSSVYQIKVSQIDNAVKKNGLFNSNEKYCNSYSSSSSSLKTLNNKGDETPIKMAPSKVNVPSCINNCGSSEIVSKLLPSCVKKDDKKRQDGFVTDGNDNFPKNDEKVTLRTKKKIGIAGLEKVQDTTTNMAMIATVYPFKRNTNQADSNQVDIKKKGYESDDDYDRSHFKIEDVTDDPNYKSPDENENYEGSLVEYCKLDQNKNAFNPRNSVFEAVSMTQQTYPEHKPPEEND